ncbi:MAG TPA: hypothetical protein VH327_09345 [Gammaproteobacteria bacterium]|nr:hypothetical protein [Gammaproteobacteria bacterium]
MQRLFRLITGISIALWLLGASNCTQNSNAAAPQFVTTLTVQNSAGQPTVSFAQGDTVQFLLTIRNRTDQAQKLFFNSDELLNLAVVDAGTATVVWTCDNDTTNACIIGSNHGTASTSGSGFNEIDFQPFQTQTVTVTWNQTDDSGAQVPVVPNNPGSSSVGQYEVMGGFTVFNTAGPGSGADSGSSMAQGPPTSSQLFPSVYRSTLSAFTIN